jgi:hypothetical protein
MSNWRRFSAIAVVTILAVFVFGALGICSAVAPLANDDVIKMVEAHLDESIIIAAINSSEKMFDLSPNGLIALQKAGVSPNVLKAMMGVVAFPEVGAGQVPAKGDFFWVNEAGQLITIPKHPGIQDVGLLSGKYVIKGKQSSFRITFSEAPMKFISKIPIDSAGVQGGDLFKLGLLKKGNRYLAMKMVLTSPGAGAFLPEFKTAYEVTDNPDGTIAIVTKGPLPAGEYAFARGSVTDAGVAFYDFGIDPK